MFDYNKVILDISYNALSLAALAVAVVMIDYTYGFVSGFSRVQAWHVMLVHR